MKSKHPVQQSFATTSDEFQDYWKKTGRKVHGGSHALGKRKTRRPFTTKKPIHLVLRALIAEGNLSMWHWQNRDFIFNTIHRYAKRCEVKIYEFSNNGNHLHLAIKAKDHKLFKKFLRIITGLIARHILKAKKGQAKGRYWAALAFTRIAEWGKGLKTLKKYVMQNILKAAGVMEYKPRKPPKIFSTA